MGTKPVGWLRRGLGWGGGGAEGLVPLPVPMGRPEGLVPVRELEACPEGPRRPEPEKPELLEEELR